MKVVAVAFRVDKENSVAYRKREIKDFADWHNLAGWLAAISEKADFVSIRFIKGGSDA